MKQKLSSGAWALVLVACALVGAGISYHFTLDARFAALEQKLDENARALHEYQVSQEELYSSKNDALHKLDQEVASLRSSQGPLGKVNQDQANALDDIRKQITLIQQAQQDAQKNLSTYATQLDNVRHQVHELATPAHEAATPPVALPVADEEDSAPEIAVAPRANPVNDIRSSTNSESNPAAYPRATPALTSTNSN